jgi:hypothetical protein
MIAADLGGGLTRNAVIGKANRMKIIMGSGIPLEGNLQTVGARTARRVATPSTPSVRAVPAMSLTAIRVAPAVHAEARAEAYLTSNVRRHAFDPDRAPEGARKVSLVDLQRGECKWPLFEDGPMLFCGCRVKTFDKDGQPAVYCEHHMAMSLPRVAP